MKDHRQIERLIFEQLLLQAAMESEFALLDGREVATPQTIAPELQYLLNSTAQRPDGPIGWRLPVHVSR